MVALDHRDARPLYLQVKDSLRRMMLTGLLTPGEKLPSVRTLARQHGVAATTVVQALHWLEDARLIVARPRSGFFVASRPAAVPALREVVAPVRGPGRPRPSGRGCASHGAVARR